MFLKKIWEINRHDIGVASNAHVKLHENHLTVIS